MLGNSRPILARRSSGVLPICPSSEWATHVDPAPSKGVTVPVAAVLLPAATSYFSKSFHCVYEPMAGTVPYVIRCTGTSSRYWEPTPIRPICPEQDEPFRPLHE